MEEKVVIILNEMSEYLSISQMKKLQEVILKTFSENEAKKQEISNHDFLKMFLDAKKIEGCSERTIQYPYYGANGIQDYVDDFIFDDELVLLAEDGGNFGSKTRPIAYRVSGKCWVNNHAHVLKPKAGLDVDYLC